MPRNTRYHVDQMPESDLAPKHLTREDFGRRLYTLMIQRGWNQSELARQADLPRDSISTYIRGRTLPTPKSLQKIADAFGMTPADVFPTALESAIDADSPSLEMKVSSASPSAAWLRVNRLVSLATAAKVVELINSDRVRDEPAHAG